MKATDFTTLTLYHGDSFGTVGNLQPTYMLHGTSNNQEGVGIYFSPDIAVAQSYGSKVSMIQLTESQRKRVKLSRSPTYKSISVAAAVNMLAEINQNDTDFWYKLTDYSIEVSSQEEVESYHLQRLFNMMKVVEIRNFQSEICMATTVDVFVTAWNNHTNIIGLYEPVTRHHSIISMSIPAHPVNF
jgi:hypothetical protein